MDKPYEISQYNGTDYATGVNICPTITPAQLNKLKGKTDVTYVKNQCPNCGSNEFPKCSYCGTGHQKIKQVHQLSTKSEPKEKQPTGSMSPMVKLFIIIMGIALPIGILIFFMKKKFKDKEKK